MSIDLTVAVPTYNGEKRLPEVLDRLRSQIQTEHFRWEVIVVDNNSTDKTAKVIRDYQANWPSASPLRYCLETKQGAGFARRRAVKEARGALVGFLDDDNLPALDWVAEAYAFAQNHPQVGAFGSQIHGAFEVPPPENFKPLLAFLAIIEHGSVPKPYDPRVLPPAAGLVIRKRVWQDCVPDHLILTGRANGNMLTGEDTEMLAHIQQAGWEIWYNPTMEIDHKIPHWRLEREYLIPFFRGIGLSRHVTRMLNVTPWQRPLAFLAYMANDLRKILVNLLTYRRRIRTNLVAACRMELFVGSLISPFYLWRNGYFGTKSPTESRRYNIVPLDKL